MRLVKTTVNLWDSADRNCIKSRFPVTQRNKVISRVEEQVTLCNHLPTDLFLHTVNIQHMKIQNTENQSLEVIIKCLFQRCCKSFKLIQKRGRVCVISPLSISNFSSNYMRLPHEWSKQIRRHSGDFSEGSCPRYRPITFPVSKLHC